MKNIKFTLTKFERGIAIQILEMEEGFKNFLNKANPTSNGLTVGSVLHPQLLKANLYLRGSSSARDFEIATHIYKDNAMRDDKYLAIITAIQFALEQYEATKPREIVAAPGASVSAQETFEF